MSSFWYSIPENRKILDFSYIINGFPFKYALKLDNGTTHIIQPPLSEFKKILNDDPSIRESLFFEGYPNHVLEIMFPNEHS